MIHTGSFSYKLASDMRITFSVIGETISGVDEQGIRTSNLGFQQTKHLNKPIRGMFNLMSDVNRWIEKNAINSIISIEIKGFSFLAYFAVKNLIFSRIPVKDVKFSDQNKLEKTASYIFLKFEEFVVEAVNNGFSNFPSTILNCNSCGQIAREFQVSTNSRLSVLVPTKNVGTDEVKALVLEIAHQIQPTDEIILVDDNSEIRFQQPELSEIFKNVVLVRGNRLGISDARNVGLGIASGEIIAFVDSDDRISEDFLILQREILISHPNIAATGTWLQAFGSHSRIYAQWDNFNPLGMRLCLPPAGVLMWKREALDILGGFNRSFSEGFEDFELVTRANLYGLLIVVIDSVEYFYQRGHSSLSQSWNYEKEKLLLGRVLENSQNLCVHKFLEFLEIEERCGTKLNYSSVDQIFTRINVRRYNILTLKRFRNNRLIFEVWEKLPDSLKRRIFNFLTR
jgi:glycosyltransferase involved in cell wall biosynthesis